MKFVFYEHPTQVKVKEIFEDGTSQIFGGIAYRDIIIAMDNGEPLIATDKHLEIVEGLPWISLSDELLGE